LFQRALSQNAPTKWVGKAEEEEEEGGGGGGEEGEGNFIFWRGARYV
jgi:hypothetical protein